MAMTEKTGEGESLKASDANNIKNRLHPNET